MHRILTDASLRAAVAAAAPRRSDTSAVEDAARFAAVLKKVCCRPLPLPPWWRSNGPGLHPPPATASLQIRTVLAKNGYTSLIYLRGYAAKLAGGPSGSLTQVGATLPHEGSSICQPPTPSQATFNRLATDAQWFLTPDEAATMWRGSLASAAGDGSLLPVATLFRALRGAMPPRRTAVVHDAFRALSGGSGSGECGRGVG